MINSYGYKRIVTDIVVRYFFADKAKGPDMAAIAAAAPEAEYVLAVIQDLMIASDPYLVGRVISFSDPPGRLTARRAPAARSSGLLM